MMHILLPTFSPPCGPFSAWVPIGGMVVFAAQRLAPKVSPPRGEACRPLEHALGLGARQAALRPVLPGYVLSLHTVCAIHLPPAGEDPLVVQGEDFHTAARASPPGPPEHRGSFLSEASMAC